MARYPGSVTFSNIAATTGVFQLKGGSYSTCVIGTGFGSLQLQRLALDGSTFVNVGSAIVANGFNTISLPSGTYKWVVTSASALYIEILPIPMAMPPGSI